ncbi:nucleotidyl transferase AbiEii/AbiGii toxin family protein [Candidatus Azambacteria bacterium]|nr:nucleotidyl transferase AbiEii/AbiGii toxin family protein [Candidatus Azambacteria bacterium]MBI3685444.1 nucleotidyl transferase AbiEii/AbiGii toxin family protein [Candidatus Azambacteria bacterium]
MDTSSQNQINWHYETLPRRTKKAFDFLSQQEWLKESKWYLAGGTALALQAGNRKSLDLDFFTEEKNFDEKELAAHFIDNKDWITEVERKNTIYGKLLGAKVSFIAYPFFMPKQKPLWHGSIRVLNQIDIAVMKITAISQRGRKRDFFDLYWCAKNIEPLEHIIKRLKVQYPSVAHDYHHILKSMVYFEDAESDPPPEIFFKASWNDVKNYFKKEIVDITNAMLIKK